MRRGGVARPTNRRRSERCGSRGRALRDRYRCVSIDARGAGASDKPDVPALHTIEHYLGDVQGVLEREGIDEFAVWGFSFGAAIGFAVAVRYPRRVRAVVSSGAWDTGPYTLEDIRRTRSSMDPSDSGGMAAMLATWEPDERPALPTWFRTTILDYDHRSWMAARYGAFCWPDIPIAAITPPTLIIVGSREDPDGEAPAWAATLPDGRCETISERTHCGTFLATAQCLAHACRSSTTPRTVEWTRRRKPIRRSPLLAMRQPLEEDVRVVARSTQERVSVVQRQATAGGARLVECPCSVAADGDVAVQLELFGRVQHLTGAFEVCLHRT